MIEPQQTDFHIHPAYSIDAKGTVEEYCLSALRKGLKRICFTTHIDLDPKREEVDPFINIDGKRHRITPKLFDIYCEDVRRNQELFAARGLEVKLGAEVDYFEGVEDIWPAFSENSNLDYVIGSVHCIDGIAFTSSKEAPRCFERYSARQFYDNYYNNVIALVNSGLFDCVGHLDGYRKYAGKSYEDGLNNPPESLVRKIFSAVLESGMGIEINSAASRHKVGQTYPSSEILKIAGEMGVRVISLGSDSHSPDGLGDGLEISSSYLHEYGLNWNPKF